MTVSDRILESTLYKSGDSFGPLRMAKGLNVTRQAANLALMYLVDQGQVQRAGCGTYCKTRPRHWIHKTRLSNANVKCFGERQWVSRGWL